MNVHIVRNKNLTLLLKEWVDAAKWRSVSGPFGSYHAWICPECYEHSKPFAQSTSPQDQKLIRSTIKHKASCILNRSIQALEEPRIRTDISEKN